MRLDKYSIGDYDPGANLFKLTIWYFFGRALVQSFLPGAAWRVSLLRMFAAQIGDGVVIKPGVQIKFPWRLKIGNHSWIGEHVWIDNLAQVEIGSHVCISQGTYFCTGNHDWTSEHFSLRASPIRIEDHVWIGAKCKIAPGVTVSKYSVLTLGSVATGVLEEKSIYQGNPATRIGERPCIAERSSD